MASPPLTQMLLTLAYALPQSLDGGKRFLASGKTRIAEIRHPLLSMWLGIFGKRGTVGFFRTIHVLPWDFWSRLERTLQNCPLLTASSPLLWQFFFVSFAFPGFVIVQNSPFYNAKGELLLVHVKKMVEVRLEAG
jgi:hypothetical protein